MNFGSYTSMIGLKTHIYIDYRSISCPFASYATQSTQARLIIDWALELCTLGLGYNKIYKSEAWIMDVLSFGRVAGVLRVMRAGCKLNFPMRLCGGSTNVESTMTVDEILSHAECHQL